jgi:hypothetical protein
LHHIIPAARPMKASDISRLRRAGQLEKFISYGCLREDGDAVLLLLDCDDECPVDMAREFAARIAAIKPKVEKPVAIGFIKKEFECLFLASVEVLSTAYPEYGWDFSHFDQDRDMDEIRGAKAMLNQLMKGHTYKETRDQARFAATVDLARLRRCSRSFRHLDSIVSWMMQD